MTDAEITEGRVPGDERRRDEEKAVRILDMIRWRLLPVLVTFSPCALERQQRSTELLQISSFLIGTSDERCFGTFIYIYQLVF